MATGKVKFILDTELNRAGINELKRELQSLKNLSANQMVDLGLSKDLQTAKKDLDAIKTSAAQVEAALTKSFSASLGTTNLSKFNRELKSLDLAKIQRDFAAAGSAGQMAFRNLTTEVLTTKLQIKETNTWLTKMGETMANTIRWGIASSAMNTLSSSAQQAWGYVKGLDKSLNDIRIVSGASAAQMEKFAAQANKAAKALGATTKDYADASLIYYQQGLSDAQVQQRTDVTMKMANVTGEAASQVSDYMTAVWNNFDDGSKSLEYYADVMTALGAATASSTDEIAAGLEKFAAIADTVGLSYEYATAALATVTSETRQSADVVGTAFKTIFARIQGLSLGDTLEDGTTLNKYSEALEKVGISIKNQNGELKDMDVILNEMGNKWDTLNKDQQVALAQTVAGVRQYNQLIALMNNWDVFESNLNTATNATGALAKQQAIYMESTQAHLDKLSASAERVFNALADTEAINGLIDGVDLLVSGLANYMESLGGLGGILFKIGAIGSKVFGKQIAQGLATTITKLKESSNELEQYKQELETLKKFQEVNQKDDPYLSRIIEMKEQVIALNKTLTAAQRDEANAAIEKQNQLQNEVLLWQEKEEVAKRYYKVMTGEEFNANGDAQDFKDQKDLLQAESDSFAKNYKDVLKDLAGVTKVQKDKDSFQLLKSDENVLDAYRESAKELISKATTQEIESVDALERAYIRLESTLKVAIESIDENQEFLILDESAKDAIEDFSAAYEKTAKEVIKNTKKVIETIDDMGKGTGEVLKDRVEANDNDFELKLSQWDLQNTIQEAVELSGHLFSIGAAISSIQALPDIFANQDLTFGEKLMQIVMTIGNVITGIKAAAQALKTVKEVYAAVQLAVLAFEKGQLKETQETTEAHKKKNEEIKTTGQVTAETAAKVKVSEDAQTKEVNETAEAIAKKNASTAEDKFAKKKQEALDSAFDKVSKKYGIKLDTDTDKVNFLKNAKSPEIDTFRGVYRSKMNELDQLLSDLDLSLIENLESRISEVSILGEKFTLINTDKKGTKIKSILDRADAVSNKQLDIFSGDVTTANQEIIPDIKDVGATIVQGKKDADGDGTTAEDIVNDIKDAGEKAKAAMEDTGEGLDPLKKGIKEAGEEAVEGSAKFGGLSKGIGNLTLKALKYVAANPYVLAAIAGVAVAVIGVTVALKAMDKVVNKNREAYEQSNKELAETQEILNQNKQAFKDFESSVISYTDAIVKVRELTVGTEEYANALAEANEQAEALIQKYELFGRYSYGEHGEIIIDPDALYEVQKEQRDALRQSELRYAKDKAKNKYLEFMAKAEEEAYGGGLGMFTPYMIIEDPTTRKQSSNNNLDNYLPTGLWYEDLNQQITDEILDVAQDEFGLNNRKNTSPVQKVEFGKADDLYADIVKAYSNIENPGIYSDEELFEMLGKEVGMTTSAVEQFGRQLINLTGSSEDFRKALDEMSDVYQQAEALREEVNKLHYQDIAEDVLEGYSFGNYTEIANKAFSQYLNDNTAWFDPDAAEENHKQIYKDAEALTFAGTTTASLGGGYLAYAYGKNYRFGEYLKSTGISGYENLSDDDIVKLYAQKVKGFNGDIDTATVEKTSGLFESLAYSLKDEDGKTIVSDKKIDEMREDLYATLQLEKQKGNIAASSNTEELKNTFIDISKNINSFDNQYGTNILSALYTAMADGKKTVSFGKEAFVGINDTEKDELLALSDDELMEKLLPDEEARNAATEQFGESLATGIRDGLKKHSYSVKEAINAVLEDVTDLSDEEKEIVGDMAKVLVEAADDTSIDKKNKYHDYLADNEEGSVSYAKKILEMNDAMELADENLEDWTEAIKNGPADLEAYSTAISGVTDVLKGLLGLDYDEFMDTEFIVKNLNDITAAIKGNEAAMKKVKKAAQDAFMEDIDKQYYQEGTQEQAQAKINQIQAENERVQKDLNNKKKQSQDGGKFDKYEEYLYNVGQAAVNAFSTDAIDRYSESLKTPSQRLQELQDQMNNLGVDGMIDGMQQGEAALLASMNRIVQDAGMTVDQTNAMFALMGYTPVYSQETVDATRYVDVVTRYSNSIDGTFNVGGSTYNKKVEEAVYTERKAVPATDVLSSVQMQTPTGDSPAPKITKLIKNPTGSSGGKKYSPKGGGGGSSKKKKDPQKDEFDRYQKVNSKLDKIGNTLDKLQDKRDKLTGQDLFDNLLKQFDTLNDKIDVTKDKLAIAIDEMNEYKQELAKDYGIKFREDGIIDNYKEQYYKELNALNAAINKYGASDKDSDQEKLEKAQERYDKFNELIKDYDELIGSFIPDLEKDIRESIDQQIEIKLDAFHYEIELRLKMKDAELEWNEFKKVVLDDIDELDIFGNTKARLQDFHAYFKEMDDGLVQVATKHVNDILTELQKMDATGEGDIYKDSRQNLMNQLNEYYLTLIDNLTEVHELSEEIHDSYMEMMDEAQSKFDEQIDAYATINDLIEHDKNVITMIYGEESYSALSQFYDRQEENNNKQLDFQKQQVEFWANQMTLVEEGSEEWDKAKENWLSAVSEWNSAVEAAIQNLQDKYLNAINEIFQKLNNEVTNGLGLDYVETQWDLVNRNAEEYLDSVNAIYNVQQLQSKYLDAIEQHDSASQQKKLNELMEQEISYLREQDKLSQYDIDRANLKYEIALKQIALEEAQQNKTQLRLRRDSQGNYTYQYTQDDDQVSSIQQEIADLYNQLYNLDAEEYRGNLESLYDVWVEFQEKMAEAAQINDPEQRAAKELLIKEQYGELINTLTEKNELIQSNLNQSTMSHLFDLYNQNIENYDMMTAEQQAILSQFMTEETDFTNAAFDNLFGLYNTTVENFQGMSNAQRDILMESIVPQWETAVQAMADKIIGEGGFFPTCAEAFTRLDEATQEYETGLATLQEVAGQSAKAIKNGLDPVIEKTQQLVKDNDMLIDTYNKELEAIRGVINELEILKAKYGEAFDAANKAAEAAKNMWMAASNKDANADPSKILNSEFGTETDITPDLNEKGGYDQPKVEPVSEPAKPTLEIGSFVDVKSGALWYSNSYGGGRSGRAKDGKIKYINSKGSHPYNIGGAGWIKKSDIVGYDTGGYTGDWGSDGRLAMLHQKELVLNASDTKNMLNAIEIVRDITSNLGATLMSRMAGISAASAYGGDSGVLEQNVHITAEFPNVENSHEIEDALNNLINKASQYIQK